MHCFLHLNDGMNSVSCVRPWRNDRFPGVGGFRGFTVVRLVHKIKYGKHQQPRCLALHSNKLGRESNGLTCCVQLNRREKYVTIRALRNKTGTKIRWRPFKVGTFIDIHLLWVLHGQNFSLAIRYWFASFRKFLGKYDSQWSSGFMRERNRWPLSKRCNSILHF